MSRFLDIHQLEKFAIFIQIRNKGPPAAPKFYPAPPLRGPGEWMAMDVEEMEGNDKKLRE